VQIHVIGVDAIKAVLSKLHEGEEILWLAGLREQTEQTKINIQLPPETTIDTIKEHAEGCGLDFMVQTP
jgi:orotidine-5'-phosphate decarboxylase